MVRLLSTVKTVLLFLFFVHGYISAEIPGDRNALYLNVVIPEADVVTTGESRYRIAANTNPGAKAFINNSEVKVYPSGAFVGLVDIEYGENIISLQVLSTEGERVSKRFTIIRPEPMKSSPADPLVIENYHMQPAVDHWLHENDILEVRFKGSPGHEATFDIGGVVSNVPMKELPKSETGGVEGIYIGHYQVNQDDFTDDVPVRFRLRKSFWSSVEAESPGRISIMPEKFPFIAEVRGTRPFFNTGLGLDRLGGARLGFIQPGVLVQIDGRVGNMYRVRLSDEMTVWIQSRFIEIHASNIPPPRALAGAITIAGDSSDDVISLQLGQKLPYLTRQLINPNRIEVDIYGVTSNTTWVTQHLSAEGIRYVTWEQRSTDQYRLIIELENPVHWGHRIEYSDIGNMNIIIRRPPVISEHEDILHGRRIAIDAGHGGNNKGALGATGTMEKEVTLVISKIVERMLTDRGATVIMTRRGDYDVPMNDRVDRIIRSNPDMVISIHCNSIGYATDPVRISGASTYYKHIGFKQLADIFYREMLKLGFNEFGVIGSFNFLLNDMIEVPNVLVETAFLSNPEDEMKLIDPEVQRRIAENIVNGIESVYKNYGTQ